MLFVEGVEVELLHLFHQALVLLVGHIAVEIVDRIDDLSHVNHLVMQVGAGHAARVADLADQLSAHDLLAGFDEDLAQVCVAGLVAVLVVQEDLLAVSSAGLSQVGGLYRRVARGIDVVADVGRQVDAFVQDASVVDRVVAVAERLDTPAQGLTVDGPDGRDCRGHVLLVLGQDLQLVERNGGTVELAAESVELLPRADHQRGVFVARQSRVFGRRIGGVDPSDIQGVGREQSPVNEVVAVVYFVQFTLLRADLVLKEPVFEDQLRIFAQDAVHFRRVEDICEDDIDDRYCDEDDEDFANDTVGAQAERDRDHLMSGRNHLTGQGVGIERLLFSCHDLKNSLEVMQN